MMMLRALGFAAVLAILPAGAQALACSVPYIRTYDNQATSGTMRTKAGQPCSIYLRRSRGPMQIAAIVQRPVHGTVSAGHRITCRPRPGFTGTDAFTYARRGLDTGNNPVTRTVRIAVTVYP